MLSWLRSHLEPFDYTVNTLSTELTFNLKILFQEYWVWIPLNYYFPLNLIGKTQITFEVCLKIIMKCLFYFNILKTKINVF